MAFDRLLFPVPVFLLVGWMSLCRQSDCDVVAVVVVVVAVVAVVVAVVVGSRFLIRRGP